MKDSTPGIAIAFYAVGILLGAATFFALAIAVSEHAGESGMAAAGLFISSLLFLAIGSALHKLFQIEGHLRRAAENTKPQSEPSPKAVQVD